MQNYDSLGRYTSAKEQAENFARQRDETLKSVSDLISTASRKVSTEYLSNDFDVQACLTSLKRASELHQNMLNAVDEANRHAESCNKPRIKIQGLDM